MVKGKVSVAQPATAISMSLVNSHVSTVAISGSSLFF